jgi:hypothetical protein
MAQQLMKDEEIQTKMDEYERAWFSAHRQAEAARQRLSQSPSEEYRKLLEEAERQKRELMRLIEALEDSLVA